MSAPLRTAGAVAYVNAALLQSVFGINVPRPFWIETVAETQFVLLFLIIFFVFLVKGNLEWGTFTVFVGDGPVCALATLRENGGVRSEFKRY